MGHAKEREGNSEGAIVDYQRALELGHGAKGPFKSSAQAAAEAAAHHRLAVTSDKLGRFPRADEHYQLALKLRPNDATFWNDAGYSDLMQGRFPEAERKLRHALKLAPSETRAANNLGLVLAATDRIDEAIELMSAHSGPAAAHANIAYVLAANGNKAEARSHYLKALELQPTLAIARDALAALDRPGAARTESLVAAPGTAAPAGSAGMVSGVVNTRDAGTVRASVPKAR
jgi:Flp pilus assembly protein TadD